MWTSCGFRETDLSMKTKPREYMIRLLCILNFVTFAFNMAFMLRLKTMSNTKVQFIPGMNVSVDFVVG